jgi:hypothetical protein
MKSASILTLFVLIGWISPSAAFGVFGGNKRRRSDADTDTTTTTSAAASSSASEDSSSSQPPEDIVDKDIYVKAVHQLTGQPEDTPKQYLVGKIDKVTLNVGSSPGLDLVESADRSLVVVSGVTQETKDKTGIEILDTIVRVNSPGGLGDEKEPTLSKSTKQLDLEQTASILMEASQHAMQQGITEIDLVLNRLVQIQYVTEEDLEKNPGANEPE